MYRKQLADLYGICVVTLRTYMAAYQHEIDKLATRIKMENKTLVRNKLNARQIEFIVVKVMQDPPEGYELKRGKLIKLNENI